MAPRKQRGSALCSAPHWQLRSPLMLLAFCGCVLSLRGLWVFINANRHPDGKDEP